MWICLRLPRGTSYQVGVTFQNCLSLKYYVSKKLFFAFLMIVLYSYYPFTMAIISQDNSMRIYSYNDCIRLLTIRANDNYCIALQTVFPKNAECCNLSRVLTFSNTILSALSRYKKIKILNIGIAFDRCFWQRSSYWYRKPKVNDRNNQIKNGYFRANYEILYWNIAAFPIYTTCKIFFL